MIVTAPLLTDERVADKPSVLILRSYLRAFFLVSITRKKSGNLKNEGGLNNNHDGFGGQ